MNKIRKRKMAAAVSLFIFSFIFTACGKKEEENETVVINKNAVYREETGFLPIKDNINNIILSNDKIYVEQNIYHWEQAEVFVEEAVAEPAVESDEEVTEETLEEETVEPEEEEPVFFEEEILSHKEGSAAEEPLSTRNIIAFDLTGKELSRTEFKMKNNEGGGAFVADSQGNIHTIYHVYATYVGDDITDKIFLKSFDPSGTERFSVHLNAHVNVDQDEYYYVNHIFMNENDQIVIDSGRGMEIYDLEGNPVRLIEKPGDMDCTVRKIRDGKFAFIISNGEKAYAQSVDTMTGQVGEKADLPFNYYRYNLQSGRYYDFYLSDEYGVYGYNLGDLELTKLMDFISSDFSGNMMQNILYLSEDEFLGSYYADHGSEIAKFIKIPAEEVKDKVELVLGCYYLDHKIKQKLIEFNKNSDQYKINILDYSQYDTMQDYSQGMTRLNTDIVAGKIPDVMILNSRMPVNSYISKGLFADLNEMIEKDDTFKKEEYLPNIFEALTSEYGMFQIAPSFTVSTFAAKTADVGAEPGWTMQEAMELLKSKPEGTKLYSELTSSNFLYYVNWIAMEDYVDWETGECKFDTEGFISLLEYAATLPKEIDYTAIMDDESYWEEMEAQYRNGKTISTLTQLSSFRDYQHLKQGTFGEDITLIGFPTTEGLGAALNFSNRMAISALSDNKEAAWAFVKEFFTEEYQEGVEYEFPVRISSLQKKEEDSWGKPYYLDDNGNKVEYEDSFYLNGMEIKMKPLTNEETAAIKEYLGSVTNVATADEAIYNIIMEEAESFLSGQKSAKDVADIIQSRVRIYVNENR